MKKFNSQGHDRLRGLVSRMVGLDLGSRAKEKGKKCHWGSKRSLPDDWLTQSDGEYAHA